MSNHRSLCSVVTIPDPEKLLTSTFAEVNGIMEWRTESQNYPEFKIAFVGPNPANDIVDWVAQGSIEHPLILHVENEGTFKYTILQYHKDGGEPLRSPERNAGVVPCKHCD